jgi:hypothetical protein
MILPSRRVFLIALGVLVFVGLLLGLPWLSPARGVERSWRDLVAAIEDNDREALASLMAENYRDGFGSDREEALLLAATIRGHFVVCSIRRESSELVMDPGKRAALARALIRIDGQGSPVAQAAIRASQASETPTEFRWRRASWKPWDWKLVSVENVDAARGLTRFRREAAALGI